MEPSDIRSSPVSGQNGPIKEFLQKFSPRRKTSPTNSPRSSPGLIRMADTSLVIKDTIKKASSLTNSPTRQFIERSTLSNSLKNTPMRIMDPLTESRFGIKYICHQCRKDLIVDHNKFLAIKCKCQNSSYFCTRECQRAHWITLNTKGMPCDWMAFEAHINSSSATYPLAEELDWNEFECIYSLDDYTICLLS